MPDFQKRSALDRLKKSLYSRTGGTEEPMRHDIHGDISSIPESWNEESINASNHHTLSPGFRKAYKIVFIASGIFFLLAFGVAGFVFLKGNNSVSVDNVDIRIEGPASVAGGDSLPLTVAVVNTNATDIELVDLVIDYPAGTKDSSDPSKDLSHERIPLGTIGSQSVIQRNFNPLMFGEEGALRDIKFTAEYRTADSNAVFFKEKTYHVTVSSSPVLVSITTFDKVVSGEPSDVTILISSNTTLPVRNLLLSLDYPSGFSIVSAVPSPTYGSSVWHIGDLAPGVKKAIKLRINIEGDDGEEKALRATVGIARETNTREIATTIITSDHTFLIEKPFLGLDLVLDGSRGDLSAQAGRPIRADLIWTNNSADKIIDTKIVATLSGAALNKNSVSADKGFYDSQTNTIVWQAGRTPGLDSIAPGETGRISFIFSSFSTSPGESFLNPRIDVSVSAEGDRVGESGAPEAITTGITHSVKFVSNLSLSSRALRSQGPISNTGPIPLKVGQASTYSVVWTVTNTSNAITGAKVTATLPQYVKWTGVTSPADASISYDEQSGLVTWNAGVIPPNATTGSGAKQVTFQISVTPLLSHANSAPPVMGQAKITGLDTFTGATLQNTAPSLSTRTSTDLLFKDGDEIVHQ